MSWRARDCHLSGHSGFIPAYHRRFCLQEQGDIKEYDSRITGFPNGFSVCFEVLMAPLLAGVQDIPMSAVL
jgi:hypothetical protein